MLLASALHTVLEHARVDISSGRKRAVYVRGATFFRIEPLPPMTSVRPSQQLSFFGRFSWRHTGNNHVVAIATFYHPSYTTITLYIYIITMIPHPTIPVLEIRPIDMVVLLIGGAVLEVLTKALLISGRKKSSTQKALEKELLLLQFETAKKRRLGPPAFVETSKLERKCLQKEKEIATLQEARTARTQVYQKLVKNVSLTVYLLIFILYYGIPMVSLDGNQVDSDDLASTSEERARGFLNGLLFPISYIGIGVKIAKIGFPSEQVGIGALVVLWSSQATVGKLLDVVEAVLLQ